MTDMNSATAQFDDAFARSNDSVWPG